MRMMPRINASKVPFVVRQISEATRCAEMAFRREKGLEAACGKTFATSAPNSAAYGGTNLAFFNALLQKLDLPPELRFADLGSGFGGVSFVANIYFSHVTGIEYDAGLVKAAKKNALSLINSTLCQFVSTVNFIDADFLQISPENFDIVFLFHPFLNKFSTLMNEYFAKAGKGTKVVYHKFGVTPGSFLGPFRDISPAEKMLQNFTVLEKI